MSVLLWAIIIGCVSAGVLVIDAYASKRRGRKSFIRAIAEKIDDCL